MTTNEAEVKRVGQLDEAVKNELQAIVNVREFLDNLDGQYSRPAEVVGEIIDCEDGTFSFALDVDGTMIELDMPSLPVVAIISAGHASGLRVDGVARSWHAALITIGARS